MKTGEAVYEVELGFLPAVHAIPDPDHPGFLRAGSRAAAPYGDDRVEFHRCEATDGRLDDHDEDLLRSGFATVSLSSLDDLRSTFARIRDAGEITDADASAVRVGLEGAVLRCTNGLTLKVRALAGEGLFMRKAGPNRMRVVASRPDGMNEHGGAISVHIDQDVFGTPLRQLMDGRAPELFRHDSPGARNAEATLMLVNLWIPLQQITQPLVLGNGRNIDREHHQLRYGLPTDSFLDRDDDQAINDIWALLHDEAQRWYFRSEMDHRSAYVFNTLSTPHGAGVLPGEDAAERCCTVLAAAETALEHDDHAEFAAVLSGAQLLPVPTSSTPALRQAVERMRALIQEATSDPRALSGIAGQDWVARSRAARNAVVRMSLELRLVVSINSPDHTTKVRRATCRVSR